MLNSRSNRLFYSRLRESEEFRVVYARGVRFNGRHLAAFVMPNDLERHRLGVTASRKAIGNAVERNRCKRLLRESFRLNHTALSELKTTYDWVFNAKRSLLEAKLSSPFEDLRRITALVVENEHKLSAQTGHQES